MEANRDSSPMVIMANSDSQSATSNRKSLLAESPSAEVHSVTGNAQHSAYGIRLTTPALPIWRKTLKSAVIDYMIKRLILSTDSYVQPHFDKQFSFASAEKQYGRLGVVKVKVGAA